MFAQPQTSEGGDAGQITEDDGLTARQNAVEVNKKNRGDRD